MPAYKNTNKKFVYMGVFGGKSKEQIAFDMIPTFRRMALEEPSIKKDVEEIQETGKMQTGVLKRINSKMEELKQEFLKGLIEV